MPSDSPPEIADAHGRIIRAARKLTEANGHHPTHLGGCIGPLSDVTCACGVTDVRFAVLALDKLHEEARHA